LAAEIVHANPNLLIAGFGTLAPKAAIGATHSIPIVFTSVADPVGAGLVASLNRPGANAAGLSAQTTSLPSDFNSWRPLSAAKEAYHNRLVVLSAFSLLVQTRVTSVRKSKK